MRWYYSSSDVDHFERFQLLTRIRLSDLRETNRNQLYQNQIKRSDK